MNTVSMLIKPASGRCNLRCRYCFYEDVSEHRQDHDLGLMDEDTAALMIRQAMEEAESRVSFAFQGGEPMVRGLPFFQRFVERYPNIKCIARHVRYAHSGSENSLKAFMWYEDHTFESKLFTFNILDRVGGGDAFASGLIYAMLHNYKPMDMVNFAVASSAIKHTIHGDANITDDVSTIRNLMDMNYDIKR